jgi:DNA-binding NarL/FixJ family response regulator
MTPTPESPIRIVIADDSYLIREAVTKLLEGDPRIEVVAVCENRILLERAIEAEHPTVVLTDIRMPPTGKEEGIEVAERLRESSPDTGIVVLSQYAEPHYALALLASGSERRGYLVKDRLYDRSELVRAIETVAAGGTVIDPKVVELLFAHKAMLERSPLTELTPREREVLALIAEGRSNTAIAEELFLTKRGVEKHINVIFMKLGLPESVDVSRRVRAAIIFLSDQAR